MIDNQNTLEKLYKANSVTLRSPRKIRGSVNIAPDKSISHRAAFLATLADGDSYIYNYLDGKDTINTLECLKQLGVKVHKDKEKIIIEGLGGKSLKESNDILNVGTSATTMRFLSGLVAPESFLTIITGTNRTIYRPMDRIISPLTMMGAQIFGKQNNTLAPLAIRGKDLQGIDYSNDFPSGEVKTALILAALKAKGKTTIKSRLASRDHTERMLTIMGKNLEVSNEGKCIKINPLSSPLRPCDFKIPNEISVAVYWIVLGLVHPDSDLLIKNVGVNPTRTGLIDILEKMGANIKILNYREESNEPVGDIKVSSSKLKGVIIEESLFPRMVDEFPGFALAASLAEGVTIIKGATDLKNKKTNRIKSIVEEFSKLGAIVYETEDGMIFEGVKYLNGNVCTSHGDHRTGNSLIMAGLVAEGVTKVENILPVARTSYPKIWDEIINVCGKESIINFE